MTEQDPSRFHRRYNLIEARRIPSKKQPTSHQREALEKLWSWYQTGDIPSGGLLVIPTGGGKTFVAVRFLCTESLSDGYVEMDRRRGKIP